MGHGKSHLTALVADMTVRQGKCSQSKMSRVSSNYYIKVRYIPFVNLQYDIKQVAESIKRKPVAQVVPAAMKLHAVVPLDENTLSTRELGCYFPELLLMF